MVKTPVNMVFFPGDGSAEFFIGLPVSGIKAAIADHFIMLFGDMSDQALDELHDRDSFLHIFAILMAVVMEGDEVAVIFVNAGSGDDRASQITADIFEDRFRVAGIGSGINVKAIFMLPVAEGLNLFKRGADLSFHFLEKGGTESVAEESIVEMFYMTPESVIAETAFGNETVDMGVPFQVPAEGMEDHDKAGDEIQRSILFKKHTGNNAVDRMEETVQKRTIMEEKIAELGIDGEYTMTVGGIDEFERHGGSAFHGVFIAAGRAEAAVTAERDEFQFSAVRTAVHSAAKGRIATVYHLIDIFHLSIPGVEGIYDFFVMVSKNFLEDIHKTIM